MKKIILIVAFAMLTVFGATAQGKKDITYVDGVTNIRIGYTGVAQCDDKNLLGGVDFGFNIVEFGVRPYDNGKISLGVDFNLNVLNAAENYYFSSAYHKTALVPSLGVFNKVRNSRLEFLSFGVPLNFTNTFGGKLKMTVGASAKINLNADTNVSYTSITDDLTRTYVSGIETSRITYDIHVALVYDDFGIYASYAPMMMLKGLGPDFSYFTVGAIFTHK